MTTEPSPLQTATDSQQTSTPKPSPSSRIPSADWIPQVASILKAGAWLIVLLFVIIHWGYFGNWLGSATHVELPGVKIDRFVEASAKVEAYAGTANARNTGFDLDFAKAAIVRAEHSSSAIKGALVLWVDSNPNNNPLETEILGDLGIRFVTARSTPEAMERLRRDKYDLVISNVSRVEASAPLTKCPVHYFGDNLDSFNAHVNTNPPGGFGLMEQMNEEIQNPPPIIFYAGTSAQKVAGLCIQTITNRVDVLLQSVVSTLEQQRWQELENQAAPPKPAS